MFVKLLSVFVDDKGFGSQSTTDDDPGS